MYFFFSLSQHTFGNAEATSTSFFFLQLIIRNSPINLSVRLTFGVSMISVMRRLVTLESELFEFFFFSVLNIEYKASCMPEQFSITGHFVKVDKISLKFAILLS